MSGYSHTEGPSSISLGSFPWGPRPADPSNIPTSQQSQKSLQSTNLPSTGSNRVPNSSPFQSTLGSDDVSSQGPDYNADTTVVEPYEIEEPDDDYDENSNVDDTSEDDTASNTSDTTGRWQKDLIDSMQDLDCRSDTSRILIRPGKERGQKRRPSGSATSGGFPRSASWTASSQGNISKYEAKYVGPKRLRKQRIKSKRDLLNSHETLLSSKTSSSSVPCKETSAETSATETGNENTDADVDAMDVD